MLIIYTHPNKEGHCGFLLKEIIKKLKDKKISFDVLDLYEMKYDPILKPSEHYTSGHKQISKQNRKIQQIIKKEEKFIFIYPTWWNNMPAILKGFIDRIFVSHYAFKYDKTIPKGLLSGKAIVLTTTGANKLIFNFWSQRISLSLMTRYLLGFCGIKAKGYSIGNATQITKKQQKKIKLKVNKGLKWLLKK